jgi:hypothetical protein
MASFCQERGLGLAFQILEEPESLSLKALPEETRKKIIFQIETWSKSIQELSQINWRHAVL